MQKIDKNLKILIGIAAVLILIISIWGAVIGIQIAKIAHSSPFLTSEISIKREASLVIDDGTGFPQNLELEIAPTSTAFDLLKKGVALLGLDLKTKIYDAGIFIESIGDKKNGESGKYWLYYVNGKMPQVSCDKQQINSGDKAEFKFQKSPF
jgi:hypothetical protein